MEGKKSVVAISINGYVTFSERPGCKGRDPERPDKQGVDVTATIHIDGAPASPYTFMFSGSKQQVTSSRSLVLASLESPHVRQQVLDVIQREINARRGEYGLPEVKAGWEFKLEQPKVKALLRQQYGLQIGGGRPKGQKSQKRKYSPAQLRRIVPETIRRSIDHGWPTSREWVARRLGYGNGKALYREQKSAGETRHWRQQVRDELKENSV